MNHATHQLQLYWEGIVHHLSDQTNEPWLQKKVKGIIERGQKVERVTFHLKPYHRTAYDRNQMVRYMISLSFLVRDQRKCYLEEGVYFGVASFINGEMIDQEIRTESLDLSKHTHTLDFKDRETSQRVPFTYNRREAVRYAERWWDSYNPAYRHFEVDCTNYVSQCLRAGGAPMWGAPNRNKGWWYGENSWSYSWAVAHSLRWYLSGSQQGLTATEVPSADLLLPGDVICYDFQGDGRFDHNTIVVKKDEEGMPLVNAHTTNSRHRYWSYEDSTAYTPQIKYKFFRIGG